MKVLCHYFEEFGRKSMIKIVCRKNRAPKIIQYTKKMNYVRVYIDAKAIKGEYKWWKFKPYYRRLKEATKSG